MDLHLNKTPEALGYKSKTQKARVITEGWTKMNLYCPVCGASHLVQFEANRPVADFYCNCCGAQFEQKSLQRKAPRHLTKINGSAYSVMEERLSSDNNPHLLLLYHNDDSVDNLILIPKHFFTKSIIAPRNPTQPKGRSKPWIGSYILLNEVYVFSSSFIPSKLQFAYSLRAITATIIDVPSFVQYIVIK